MSSAVNEREHLLAQLAATVSEALAIREERDRLRDLVRRLADNLARFHIIGQRDRALLREAEIAGAGETPTRKGVGR